MEKTYYIGQKFIRISKDGGYYGTWILASACHKGNKSSAKIAATLIDVNKGCTLKGAVYVEDLHNITEKEFREICDGLPSSFDDEYGHMILVEIHDVAPGELPKGWMNLNWRSENRP